MKQTYTFHVEGMHCNACVALIESELSAVPEISAVTCSLHNHSVRCEGDFIDKNPAHSMRILNEVLHPHGYTLVIEKSHHAPRWQDFKLAVPLAAAFIAVFIVLQWLDIVNLVTAREVSYGTAFIIGIIASLSTCMAVVGGLALSLGAQFAKEGDKIRPQILFHLGRLVSFFILGGAIGTLGSAFQLGAMGTFIISMLVAVVLLILGINLLDIAPRMKQWQFTMPKSVGRRVHGLKKINHTLTPALAGVATFFLPCGFTQSMQIYTLTTGSFMTGALIMGVFALGTLPILALLSFGSLSVHTKAQSGIFFKTAGLVVIFFGILNAVSSVAAAGIIPPLLFF